MLTGSKVLVWWYCNDIRVKFWNFSSLQKIFIKDVFQIATDQDVQLYLNNLKIFKLTRFICWTKSFIVKYLSSFTVLTNLYSISVTQSCKHAFRMFCLYIYSKLLFNVFTVAETGQSFTRRGLGLPGNRMASFQLFSAVIGDAENTLYEISEAIIIPTGMAEFQTRW